MHIVLYRFRVKSNKEEDFIKGWKGLTELIYKYEGSLGSRLHKGDELNYIAYAQWPDQLTFETSGKNLPEQANHFRTLMRSSCSEIEVLQSMDIVEDLLKNEQSE